MSKDLRYVIMANMKVPGMVVEEIDHLDQECKYKLYDKEIREKHEALYQARKIKESLKDRFPTIVIKIVTI